MKKVIPSIIFGFLTFSCLISIGACFESSVPAGVLCVLFTFLFSFLTIRPFLKKKEKKNSQPAPSVQQYSAPSSPAPQITTTPAPPVQQYSAPSSPAPQRTTTPSPAVTSTPYNSEQAKENRRLFIEKKRAEFDSRVNAIPRADISLSETPAQKQAFSDMPEIKSRNITRATRLETLFPLVVLDVETTGLNKQRGEIIEVSAIKYSDGFVPVSCFSTLTKPKKPIPPDATAINNITDEMVSNSPAFSSVADSFSEFIRGCNVAGHNLITFDLPFLFINGVKLSDKVKYFDTLDLAKLTLTAEGKQKYDHRSGEYVDVDDYDVEDYKLETLCEHYYIFRSDAHRSLSDCYATGLVLQNLIEDKTE